MDSQKDEMKESNKQSHDVFKHKMKQGKLKNTKMIFFGLVMLIALVGVFIYGTKVLGEQEKEPVIINKSTIEEIINISELNTFQAVYNGIAEVKNEKKPEETDYYVSYEAKVNAGFDFSKVKILVDEELKIISIDIVEIVINEVNVDITSLDYIFQNSKANTSTVSEKAYRTSIEDVTNESKENSAIIELAGQNAKNIMSALVNPFVKQLDSKYEIIVTVGGVK